MLIVATMLLAAIILNKIAIGCKAQKPEKSEASTHTAIKDEKKKKSPKKSSPPTKTALEIEDVVANTALSIDDGTAAAVPTDANKNKQKATSTEEQQKQKRSKTPSSEEQQRKEEKKKEKKKGDKKDKKKKKPKKERKKESKNVCPTQAEGDASPQKAPKVKSKPSKGKKPRPSKERGTPEGTTQDTRMTSETQPTPVVLPNHRKSKGGLVPPAKVAKVVGKETDSSAKRLVSNPIVTPVTDEFPTEDDAKTKMTLMMTVDENVKTAPEKRTERKEEQVEDYEARKRKRGKERNISDPILTPCTDEFPTDEEILKQEAAKAAAAKKK